MDIKTWFLGYGKWILIWLAVATFVGALSGLVRYRIELRKVTRLTRRLTMLMRALGKQVASDDFQGDRADDASALILKIIEVRDSDAQALTVTGLEELCRQCESQLARQYLQITTFRKTGRAS